MDKNNTKRTTKLEYLQYHTTVIVVINDNGEIEMKPTKDCKKGESIWVLEGDNTFTKTMIC